MTYGLFEVIGSFNYRGHARGERFEARVTPQIARGIARGNIVMLEEVVPEVPPGYALPEGWLPSGGRDQTTTRRRGASLS